MLPILPSLLMVFVMMPGSCLLKPVAIEYSTPASGVLGIPNEDETKGNTTPQPQFPGGYTDDLDWLREYFKQSKELRDRLRGKFSNSPYPTRMTGATETLTAGLNVHSSPQVNSGNSNKADTSVFGSPGRDSFNYDWLKKFDIKPTFRTQRPPFVMPKYVTIPSINWKQIERMQEISRQLAKDRERIGNMNWNFHDRSHESDNENSSTEEDDDEDESGLTVSPLFCGLIIVGAIVVLSCMVSSALVLCRCRANRAVGNRLPSISGSTGRRNRRPQLLITVRPSDSRQNLFSPTDASPSTQSDVMIGQGQSLSDEQQDHAEPPPAYGICVDNGLPSYNEALISPTTNANVGADIECNLQVSRPPSYSTVVTGGVAPPSYTEACREMQPGTETAADAEQDVVQGHC